MVDETNDGSSALLREGWFLEDLAILLENINDQIQEVEIEAKHLGIQAKELRTSGGDWPLRSLLIGKAQVINAMTLMKMMDGYASTINIYNNTDSST